MALNLIENLQIKIKTSNKMETTSFQLSRRIKDKKIKRKKININIYVFWCLDSYHEDPVDEWAYLMTADQIEGSIYDEHVECPAYTLDELLNLLPDEIILLDKSSHFLAIRRSLNMKWPKYCVCYEDSNHNIFYPSCFSNKNAAEAAGQLLIWCIENKYL